MAMLISENQCDLLRNHLGDKGRFAVKIEYFVAQRMGAAGALGAAAALLGGKSVVYYGDVLSNMDLKTMVDFRVEKKAVCTGAPITVVPIGYALGRVAEDGKIA